MSPKTGRVIPPGAIAELKANPTGQARKHFDEWFGAGTAAKVLGK